MGRRNTEGLYDSKQYYRREDTSVESMIFLTSDHSVMCNVGRHFSCSVRLKQPNLELPTTNIKSGNQQLGRLVP